MYALVRFRDDNAKVVVSVSKMKHFAANDVHDFDSKKWYQVYWQDEKQKGYFKAQVLRLFETQEEAEQQEKTSSLAKASGVGRQRCLIGLKRSLASGESHWLSKEKQPRCVHQLQQKPSPPVRVSPERAETTSPAVLAPDQALSTRPESSEEANQNSVSQEDSESSETRGPPKQFSQIGNEVFLGSGVWIQKSVYDHLMQRPKDGIFVREASVKIFSTAGLFNRSVTGAASNRTKTEAKQPLDPAKYGVLKEFFHHYLERRCSSPAELALRHSCVGKIVACKIADLMKGQKRPL
ncbi:uncharacterized protein LOC125756298 [Rhipicephalus sanguineus]|uniref:uncharacterized protein LOC125756298 n=1 Tax=Rhipicephalus sanguineus TaxID=34632 RepID=UPI0020C1F9C1|nr:uncharacterized protein LOC125756298 [Rhipicephalus sanguineus]